MVRFAALVVIGALALPAARASAQEEPSDSARDQRILSSAAAAESLQGPLDGGWTLVSSDGKLIYGFQIVDKPSGETPEGVWRDLRRPNVPGDIGLIDTMQRAAPDALTIRFVAVPGQAPTTIALKLAAGVWSGDMTEAGAVTKVALRRN
jgi:hypothetical protein